MKYSENLPILLLQMRIYANDIFFVIKKEQTKKHIFLFKKTVMQLNVYICKN